MADAHVKEALAIHELASLAGLETTGTYPISARYLQRFGDTPQAALVPACGRIESSFLAHAQEQFAVGEVSGPEVAGAKLALQQKLLQCRTITIGSFCETAPAEASLFLDGVREDARVGVKTTEDVERAELLQEQVGQTCRGGF